MAKSAKLKEPKVIPRFDPSLPYSWKTDDILGITGAQLDALNKIFGKLSQEPEVQKAIAIIDGIKIVNSVIQAGVEEEIILPTPPEAESVEYAEEVK